MNLINWWWNLELYAQVPILIATVIAVYTVFLIPYLFYLGNGEDRYHSWIASFLAVVNQATGYAITISSTCTLYSTDKAYALSRPIWRAEEEAHKARIAKMGWTNHMATYVWRMLTVGYNNDLEKDAKERAVGK